MRMIKIPTYFRAYSVDIQCTFLPHIMREAQSTITLKGEVAH